MQHLIDVTNDVHYERYRSNKLAGLSLTTSMKRCVVDAWRPKAWP